MAEFEAGRSESFYSLSCFLNKVITMSITKQRIKLGSKDSFDTDLIYARMMGLMNSKETDIRNVFFPFELAPVPISVLEDSGDLRTAKPKSKLKVKL